MCYKKRVPNENGHPETVLLEDPFKELLVIYVSEFIMTPVTLFSDKGSNPEK